MSGSFIFCFVFLLLQTSCFARDFVVEFIEENYKETRSSFSYSPLIYHSIQVRSESGPKLLILKGDNYNYRKWLRQYIADNKAFIAKVQDDQTDFFIASNAFEIDVINLHPFNLSFYRQGEEKSKEGLSLYDLENDRYKETDKKIINQTSRQEFDKKKTEKDRIDQGKKQQTEAPKNDQTKEADKKRLEKEKLLTALAEKQSVEDLKLKEALGKKRKAQDQLLAILSEQKAVEKQRREEDLEQRWLELKNRLMEDERIKGLDQAARRSEIERRWLELKQSFEQE